MGHVRGAAELTVSAASDRDSRGRRHRQEGTQRSVAARTGHRQHGAAAAIARRRIGTSRHRITTRRLAAPHPAARAAHAPLASSRPSFAALPRGHTGDGVVLPRADRRSAMEVTKRRCRFSRFCHACSPARLAGLSLALLKATALEIAILAGHLLLYPSGITQERRAPRPGPAPRTAPPSCPRRPSPRSSCCTASSTTAPSSSCCAAASPSTAGSRSSPSTTPR